MKLVYNNTDTTWDSYISLPFETTNTIANFDANDINQFNLTSTINLVVTDDYGTTPYWY